MTSAVDALARQQGKLDDPSLSERGAELVDVSDFLLDVVRDKGLDIDIGESITDGYIERTIDGASTLQVVVHDPNDVLMKSDIFGDGAFFRFDQESPFRNINPNKPHFKAIDVNLDGLWFRLAQIQKTGKDITLTFEDRIIAFLKIHDTPRKASRGNMTRAEFVRMLVREVKTDGGIDFFSPDLHKQQKKAKIARPTDNVRRHERSAGLLATTDINVKGDHAQHSQLVNAEAILDTGSAMGANKKCLYCSIMVSIQESSLSNAATNGSHVGAFQQDSTPGSSWKAAGGASRNIVKDAQAFFKTCMSADAANPSMTLVQLCEAVQHSGQGSLYGAWTTEAKKIVNEYGGGSLKNPSTVSVSRSYYKSYEFHRGRPDGPKNENTWECAARLAQDVNWRRFVVGNTFFFVDDEQLMRAKPIMELSEDDEGVDSIDFDIDSGKSISEATVTCRADRWLAHPGEVVRLTGVGPANGRWLVYTIHRGLYETTCEITLRQPEAQKPEPAPELVTVSVGTDASGIATGGVVHAKGMRAAIVKAAQLAASYGSSKYTYGQVRPYPKSLFGKGTIVTDCSGFAILCYKAAGATDPNGTGYNGSGNTGSLMANGTKIHAGKLKPGDMVFYRSPEHVAIYIDNGQVIEFGGNPGPRIEPVNYRNDILGYYSFDLSGTPNKYIGKGPGPWAGAEIAH